MCLVDSEIYNTGDMKLDPDPARSRVERAPAWDREISDTGGASLAMIRWRFFYGPLMTDI